eukprot:664181-Prymnesium_polylepis.1
MPLTLAGKGVRWTRAPPTIRLFKRGSYGVDQFFRITTLRPGGVRPPETARSCAFGMRWGVNVNR